MDQVIDSTSDSQDIATASINGSNDCPEKENQTLSLQEAFQQFRDERIKVKRIYQRHKDDRTESFKDQLREMFVARAKSYIGVPYSRQHDPNASSEDDSNKLYLDCCGLVRQVVRDLQDEFGFVIGRWNQAYQLDTLPCLEDLTPATMRPGDLVFYEGTYFDSTRKRQKHDIVHVEIFLGGLNGEETIGARNQKGGVSIFPSFKFVSKSWQLVRYHFRSIDAWLDGVCVSNCPEHPWKIEDALLYDSTKRSIFHVDDAESDGDELGGCGDEVEGDDTTAPEIEDLPRIEPTSRLRDSPIRSPMQYLTSNANKSFEVDADATEREVARTSYKPTPIDAIDLSMSSENTSKFPRKTSRRISSLQSPSNASNLTETNKSTEKAANSANNNRESIERSIESLTKATSSSLMKCRSGSPSSAVHPRTYYVGKSNGWKLVVNAMNKHGWQQLPFEYNFSSRYGFKWVERRSQIDYKSHTDGQLVNHIPNNDCITTKTSLHRTLVDYFCVGSGKVDASKGYDSHNVPWLPATYRLDIAADCAALLRAEREWVEANGQDGIWIYKPACNNRGRGIKVVSGYEALQGLLSVDSGSTSTSSPIASPANKATASHGSHGIANMKSNPTKPAVTNYLAAANKGIVQKYIENPLLVGEERLKFDIRCYLLIARTHPTTIAYYHKGYCRLSLKSFDVSKESLEDATIHLTNAAIQKQDAGYYTNKEKQIQLPGVIADTIERHGDSSSASYIRNQLDHDIKRCMVDVLKASNHILAKKHGYFDLLGCDFMITASNELKLLEINTNPALSLDNSTLEALLPGVVEETIDIVVGLQGCEKGKGSEKKTANISTTFELIFDEAKRYCYE